MTSNGLIIAAPSTGAGKTTLTLGLLRAFARRGIKVAPAKIGPDYIDPRFHEQAAGMPCVNLDGWAMRPELLSKLTHQLAAAGELVIAEGVMGLFDGGAKPGQLGRGSTADLAKFTRWPVLLIVNCAGTGQSIGALVKGFAGYDKDVRLAGVIFNNVAGPRHEQMLRDGLTGAIPVLGVLPPVKDLKLPSRHLGLVQAFEHVGLEQIVERMADLIAEHCDVDSIARAAGPMIAELEKNVKPIAPLGQIIAVAHDEAFAFSYHHLLRAWREAGAEIKLFSPLDNEPPDDRADAIYLPGGYPELHAGRLSAAGQVMSGLRDAASRRVQIYGECGGYMVLGEGLVDANNIRHEMAGLLALETSFAERRLHLGYRRLKAAMDFAGQTAGNYFRAHEFHYASTLREEGEALFEVCDEERKTGLVRGTVSGSFMHLIDREE